MSCPFDPVEILEVGPRDGLQNLKTLVATEDKLALIRRLAEAGLSRIQIGGFVSPKAIPQFHDIVPLARKAVERIAGVDFSALVPNLKGAENAIGTGIRHLTFVFSVSREHNLTNVRKTPQESINELENVVRLLESYPEIVLSVDLATAFGCPFVLAVSPEDVLESIRRVNDLGLRHITLADTVGYGNPRRVHELVSKCRQAYPETVFRCHFHNTRGLGLANTLAAYFAGIRSFDSSVGGLGGCPYAPGATGNIATEDMVFMFHEMGISTGVDLKTLFGATSFVLKILPEAKLESQVFRAGIPKAAPRTAQTG